MSPDRDKYGRVIPINCYGNEHLVKKGSIVIGNMNDFALTEGRLYVVQNADMFIEVINDENVIEQYSFEYFDLYQGQKVKDY
ncbi:hypothetical protein ACFQZE_06770 [Paenibacillus sp. GCM10027627]|uniref:hypothetical protein n=1 Tax=unclassified Paenibacillus TaxID=185978 RepID=UPI00363CF89F